MKHRLFEPCFVALAFASVVGCATPKVAFESAAATQIAATPLPPPPPPPAPPPPPPPPPVVVKHVQVQGDHIVIDEKIQFTSNNATILPASDGLLDEIAGTMKEHAEIKKIEVQGHASAEGNPAANKKLSGARAKSVVAALVSRGIEEARLTGKGYGSEKPLADNKTPEGREKNRRVEFLITEPKADTTKEGTK